MTNGTLIARIELVNKDDSPMSLEEAQAEAPKIRSEVKPFLLEACPGIKGARPSSRIVQEGGKTYYEILDLTPGSKLQRVEDICYRPD